MNESFEGVKSHTSVVSMILGKLTVRNTTFYSVGKKIQRSGTRPVYERQRACNLFSISVAAALRPEDLRV